MATPTGVRIVKGCCPLDCPDSCAWTVHVEDGRVARLEGARTHPVTRGVLCAKVHDYPLRLRAPDRLLHPLLRDGPKGAGRFRRIGWDEAVARIAERFGAIAAAHGGEALLPVAYMGSLGVVQRRAPLRLFHALGASRFHGSICGASGNALAAEGHPIGFDPEEMSECRLVVLWGANVLTTSPHQWRFIKAARSRHGARVVTIDPRRTVTARAGDEHIPIRPGSDAVLAAGLARIWLHEGLADLEFANSAAHDVEAFREQVEPWDPARVAGVCGIPAATVVGLAHAIAAAQPTAIRAGIGPQQTVHGEAFVRLLSALAIVGGHWRRRGGGLLVEAGPRLRDEPVGRPDLAAAPTRSFDFARLGATLTDPDLDPPVMGMMIWGTNPAVTQPDGGRVREGLAREDLFTVVVEHFMTDTAAFADIVLPSTMQLEHFDLQGAWGHRYVTANTPAVEAAGEALSHGEIVRRLARAMRLTHPALHETDAEMASAALPSRASLDAAMAAGWIKDAPGRWSPSAGAKLRLCGGVPLPPAAPAPGLLQLLTPKGHYFLNSSFANADRHRRAMKEPMLEIHPEDAAARGLADGQEVEIRGARGRLRVRLAATDAIRRGVVALCGKWWTADLGAASNINGLAPAAWSAAGQPAFNDVFIEVLP
ncbi:MAG: molybdopterin-dependent oxidoreductase [Alphaproteobacteria bacterium]|nr:molybdopterin-dependent oxidoreductase [Alphaproteobacteria bacterium]